MPIHCIADAEKDAGMKTLKSEEAITILEDMKVNISIPKAAVTQIKRNAALNMAIEALSNQNESSEQADHIADDSKMVDQFREATKKTDDVPDINVGKTDFKPGEKN